MAVSLEETIMMDRIEELYEVAQRLREEHADTAGILTDVLGYISGDILDVSGIIELKLISLSLGENTQQHLERVSCYHQMKYNSQK